MPMLAELTYPVILGGLSQRLVCNEVGAFVWTRVNGIETYRQAGRHIDTQDETMNMKQTGTYPGRQSDQKTAQRTPFQV